MITTIKKQESIAQVIQSQVAISKIDWITNIRQQAYENFVQLGIPNRRHEDWKYSTPEPFFKKELQIAKSEKIEKSDIQNIINRIPNSYVIVTVNGYVDNALSNNDLIEKISISNMKDAFKSQESIVKKHLAQYTPNDEHFAQLNNAAFTSGIYIYLKAYEHVAKTIHIINIVKGNEAQLINSRNLIVIDGNSSCNIVEEFIELNNKATTVRNHVTEMVINENAIVKYDVLQQDGENTCSIYNNYVVQHNSSVLTFNTITASGNFVRNNLNIYLRGKNITSNLNGLFVSQGNEHVDNHTLVDHEQPHCDSNELYKGILKDNSIGVFNGKIYVRPQAQKTNAYQSSKNMLLSEHATINTKPQLEIYADDVKCSHGTSTGQIDDDALFYLQARGIGKDTAKLLMMQAFAGEVIEKINNPYLAIFVTELIDKKLNK